MHKLILFILILLPLNLFAQAVNWIVEAEDNLGTIKWSKGICDIDAPKGLTLWNKNLMVGNVLIEYEARIVPPPLPSPKERETSQGVANYRVSDLNCFVMADKCGEHQSSAFHNGWI